MVDFKAFWSEHQLVDLSAGLGVERDESADGAVSSASVAEFIDKHGDIFLLAAKITQLGRHADGNEEFPEGFDSLLGGNLGMIEIHLASPDPYGDLGKSRYVMLHAVCEDRGHYYGKTGTVSTAVKS